jgi:hypothetical protein
MAVAKPTLWIKPSIWAELQFYAWNVDGEVGGLGRITADKENNNFFVEELYLIEQKVDDSECTLTSKDTDRLFQELLEAGKIDEFDQTKFWWHSHKHIPANFSGTDDKYMSEWVGEYLVSLVVNRDGKCSATLTTTYPVLASSEIDVEIDFAVPNPEELLADIKAKVSKVPIVKATDKINTKGKKIESPYQGVYGWSYYEGFGGNGNKKVHDLTDAEWEEKETREESGYDDDEWAAIQKQLDEEEAEFWEEYEKYERANA